MKAWIALAFPLGFLLVAGGQDVPRRRIPQPAQVTGSLALTQQVDTYLSQRWSEEGLTPSDEVDALAFARRLWLDLLGTIPSLEEVRRLQAELPAGPLGPEGRQALVDHVMADRRFAETLAERLARIAVGEGGRPDDLLYRRRRMTSWLTGQIARHRPWDELVRELLTAQGLSTSSPAVNFIRSQEIDPAKLAARSTRAFLGIRIDCAQCHDHFFADWTQGEFEGIAAYFARIEQNAAGINEMPSGEYELEVHPDPSAEELAAAHGDEDQDQETTEAADDADGSESEAAATAEAEGEADEAALSMSGDEVETRTVAPSVPFSPEWVPADAPTRRHELAAWITHPENPYFARAIVNRLWSWLLGRGFVEPVDELDLGDPEEDALLELLSADLVANGFRLERTIRAIVSSQAYALSSAAPNDADERPLSELWAVYALKPLRADQLGAATLQATSFWTYDHDRSQIVRLGRFGNLNDFTNRRGEDPDAESVADENLLQRLQVLNGKQFHERSKDDDIFSVVNRLPLLSPTDDAAVDNAFLMALTRLPTDPERDVFVSRLQALGPKPKENARSAVISDLLWALVNTTEFAWNH